jgi:hypothetical protein
LTSLRARTRAHTPDQPRACAALHIVEYMGEEPGGKPSRHPPAAPSAHGTRWTSGRRLYLPRRRQEYGREFVFSRQSCVPLTEATLHAASRVGSSRLRNAPALRARFLPSDRVVEASECNRTRTQGVPVTHFFTTPPRARAVRTPSWQLRSPFAPVGCRVLALPLACCDSVRVFAVDLQSSMEPGERALWCTLHRADERAAVARECVRAWEGCARCPPVSKYK